MSATLRAGGTRCPAYIAAARIAAAQPGARTRYPLAFISPPARNFLNSSFANLPAFVAEEKHAELDLILPTRRRAASRWRCRSASSTTAAASPRRRASATRRVPALRWRRRSGGRRYSPDGCNANAVTSQALTDLGRAATFYDCLVEVARA
jgi:hypothetical protein